MSDDKNVSRLRVIKTLDGFSCAHRHHSADGHCRFVHGYERSFTLVIEGVPDNRTGWVIDFGSFGPLRTRLADQFDHTLIVSAQDPLLPHFRELHKLGGCDLRVMEHPGMEGAAQWVYDVTAQFVRDTTEGRAYVVEVEARENGRNAVSFAPRR